MTIAILMAQNKKSEPQSEDFFQLMADMELLLENSDDRISNQVLSEIKRKLSYAFSNEKLRKELENISAEKTRASSS